jgi:hypothetical protein
MYIHNENRHFAVSHYVGRVAVCYLYLFTIQKPSIRALGWLKSGHPVSLTRLLASLRKSLVKSHNQAPLQNGNSGSARVDGGY